ncbi:MAG: hypothetical protein HY676_04190 [Chloroflexi bacterium]|nr:hypothetical protein [Chloroflexota bacterium]
MDPQPLVAQTWDKLSEIVYFLWFFLAAMSAFGGSFLLAHAIIPSLVTTGHISVRVGRFYDPFFIWPLCWLWGWQSFSWSRR